MKAEVQTYECFAHNLQLVYGSDYVLKLNYLAKRLDNDSHTLKVLVDEFRFYDIEFRYHLLELTRLRGMTTASKNVLLINEVIRREFINTLNYRINVDTLADLLSRIPSKYVEIMTYEIANDGLNGRTEFLTEEERNRIVENVSKITGKTYERESTIKKTLK